MWWCGDFVFGGEVGLLPHKALRNSELHVWWELFAEREEGRKDGRQEGRKEGRKERRR